MNAGMPMRHGKGKGMGFDSVLEAAKPMRPNLYRKGRP